MSGPIFLIGYMACGKTTLGNALKETFPEAVDFVDMDEEIERRAGMTVSEIFAAHGEASFRLMEAEMLEQLCHRYVPEGKCLVVGCGGGTPCHGHNMERMLSTGTVVWLKANRERTISRLLEFRDKRPLLAGMSDEEIADYADRHLAERTPCYSRAHLSFDSSYLETPAEIAQSIILFKQALNELTYLT